MRLRWACAAIIFLPALVLGQTECRIRFEGHNYPYYVLAPTGGDGTHEMPALVLLHGGGGNGLEMIPLWKNLAQKNGILLIAPSLPTGPDLEPRVHALLHAIVESVKGAWKVDARRVYLFGHSMGGTFTFDAATQDSNTYAAAAVHASVIDADYDWIAKGAVHKTPFAIYIGDGDQFFSLARARRTHKMLVAEGFQVHYVEMAGHDHNYYAVRDEVNRDAWKFLSEFSLPQ